FELLLCHRMSLQGQECGDLILISAKSSIYSTKPNAICNKDVSEEKNKKHNKVLFTATVGLTTG
ncbi:hypothetical protein F9C28_11620, partial [Shimwellia pseudoproteus]|uniref:hypothetical protein n=1 Tax=Shimwellia pseudoproteus TaxID=570012 RepID=UPI001E61062E